MNEFADLARSAEAQMRDVFAIKPYLSA